MLKLTLAGAALATAFAAPALANPALPGLPDNLNFDHYTGSAPKGPFTSVAPVGWTGGSGLIFIAAQDFPNSAAGPIYLTTYGNPSGNVPGNYVEADGNPSFESGFNYTVHGLTVGQTYTLSFYQGASQQAGFTGDTTDRWIVSLGTAGLSLVDNGRVDPTFGAALDYTSTDATASIAASDLMTVPSGTAVGWNFVSVDLTADAPTDILSFLAYGNNGSTVNLPPIAFLAGVNAPPGLGVPEPATLSVLAVGAIGLGASAWRRARRS